MTRSRPDIRDFKIRDATASRTRWLIMDWDKNAVVCAGKVKLRSPSRSKTTRLRNALYQCDSSAFLSQKKPRHHLRKSKKCFV